MSTTVVRQVTVSTRTLILALTAFTVALALAIALPLALRSDHTVFVRTGNGTAVTPSTSSVTTDSQTRMGDSTPTGRAQTDSQTRMFPQGG